MPPHSLTTASARLRDAGVGNHRREAEWLFEHITGLSRGALLTAPELALTVNCLERFEQLVQRRLAGEPLQYLIGGTEFYGRPFMVGPGVLIPRPETERLAEFAIDRYPGRGAVCDLCTGSGVVAITLRLELGQRTAVVASDTSAAALAYAGRNREALGAAGVGLIQGDLLTPLRPNVRFTLITANPPYVSPAEFAELPPEVRDHEPPEALLAADGGLAIFGRIAESAPHHLEPGGWLLCEIGEEQGARASDILTGNGFADVSVERDYAGRDRVTCARWPVGSA